jgi:hypothetical protein
LDVAGQVEKSKLYTPSRAGVFAPSRIRQAICSELKICVEIREPSFTGGAPILALSGTQYFGVSWTKTGLTLSFCKNGSLRIKHFHFASSSFNTRVLPTQHGDGFGAVCCAAEMVAERKLSVMVKAPTGRNNLFTNQIPLFVSSNLQQCD